MLYFIVQYIIFLVDCSVKSCGSECYLIVFELVNVWLYIGVFVVVVVFVIIFIVFVVFIFWKIRQNSIDDIYFDVVYDFDMINKFLLDCEDYNIVFNYYLVELSVILEESINIKVS